MGIRVKVLIIMVIMGIVAALAIGITSYQFNVKWAMRDAKSKGQIVLNYVHSTRKYLKNSQRPLIMEVVEEDRFYPELMSGFAVARGTYDIFKKELPDYIFKQATIDPLLPSNKADSDELEIIELFQSEPERKTLEGTVVRGTAKYYYFAQPIKIKDKKCLVCHGDPADAPKDQIEFYGTKNGYFWEMGSTVAAFIVYIPLKKALDTAKQSTFVILLIGVGCLVITLLGTWLFLNRQIVSPILKLSSRADEISLGKNLTVKVESPKKDEIGMLAEAIERLRSSMILILKRRQNAKKKERK